MTVVSACLRGRIFTEGVVTSLQDISGTLQGAVGDGALGASVTGQHPLSTGVADVAQDEH